MIQSCRAVSRVRTAAIFASIVGAGLGGIRDLGAQRLAIPRGTNETQIVAAAERDGAVYPHPRFTDVVQAHAALPLDRLAGEVRTASPRVCVTGHDVGPAVSGEFRIGGNLAGSSSMHAGRPGKVWWAPLHYAADMPPLVVRGRSLTTPSDTVRFTSSKIGWQGMPGARSVPPAMRKYFFPSGITIPRSGRWLVIATSGPNWGCFILTVT